MAGSSAHLFSEKRLEKRLDSWKEIATYLARDVTTVQRWEKREGMPVHRHVHEKRGSVYAVAAELDDWIQSRKPRVDEPGTEATAAVTGAVDRSRTSRSSWVWVLASVAVCLTLALWLALRRTSPRGAAPPTADLRIRSLAVLPLRNLSGDPAQEYLADGITEALTGRLSDINTLRVISHTSVLRFKDPQISVPEIARMLGVDAVVEGSVMKEGDRIRVTAQLIRGATDQHFWSQTYDRQMRDALSLESEMAQSIADKVEVTVTGRDHQRLSDARPVAPEVYESYLQGNFALHQGNKAAAEQSVRYFEDATAKDPTFAPAYLGMAKAYSFLGTVFAGSPASETRPRVITNARKALALDPNLDDAHVVLAETLQQEWHWAEAEAEYKQALELNPNDASGEATYALWLSCQGRVDEAIDRVRRAQALDPLGISGADVSWIFFQAHHYKDAIRESRSAIALQPDNAIYLTGLGFALIADNQPEEAITVLEKAIAVSKGSPAATGILIRAYAHAGRRDDALKLLDELQRRRKTGYVPAGAFVNAYLGLGDNDQAFYWLKQAVKEQSNILQFLKTHPYFDPIRKDPRFVDLLRQTGLS